MFLMVLIIIILLFLLTNKKESFETIKKGFENIDHIFYINLEHRLDRNSFMINQLQEMGIPSSKITRINAVMNKDNGHKGCTASHLIALNTAKWNNYKNILILEDDFEFTKNKEQITDLLTQFFNEVKEWDVLMFDANPCKLVDTKYQNLKKVECAATASGYLVNNHYYNKLIEIFSESYVNLKDKLTPDKHDDWAHDQNWKKLQKTDNWYVFNPVIGKQQGSYSDIMKND